MTAEMSAIARRTGVQAVLAGVLLAASLGAELIHPVQSPDGTTTEPLLHALYLLGWLAGSVLLAVAAMGLGSLLRAGGRVSRAVTIGMWSSVAGAACFALSTIGGFAGIIGGTYFEGAFVLVLVGFPLLIAGNLALAFAARSASPFRGVWPLLAVACVGLVVALVADADPFHDIGFMLFFASWIVLGFRLRLTAGTDAPIRSNA